MAYVTKICEGCGQEFTLTPGKNGRIYHAKRFCARKCWLTTYNREDRVHNPGNLIVFKNQADHSYHHRWCMERPTPCECMCIRLKDLVGGDAL